MILVTGATGNVGRELVAQLVAKGERVRALTRDPKKATFPQKVESFVGDLAKPETLSKAMEGVDRLFSLATGPQLAELEGNLAQAAKRARVRHVVKLSVLGAGSGMESPMVAWHEGGERAFQNAGVPWTFVRPGYFMSNAIQWAGSIKSTGKVFLPYGDGKLPPVHPRDIAAVCATCLTSTGHEGKAYPLTGGQALSAAEMAGALSEVVGRPIEYVAVSDEAARDGMLKMGLPSVLVEGLLQLAGMIRAGKVANVLPTVKEVLGREPLTFAQWAKENAAAFR
jgi:uncharacterized protein YbjT (DUF2867 family)